MEHEVIKNMLFIAPVLKYFIIFSFCFCYILVIFEEVINFKKSKVVIIFSGIMWFIVAFYLNEQNDIINMDLNHVLLEYINLFLFLFVTMVYINSLKFFKILDVIKYFLIVRNLSYKKIYFVTGLMAFFISPIADNLTTALLMSSIILHIEKKDKKFINLACINIVVAANAGGAFSPFGDITTLMIWQSNIISFIYFSKLFIPSFVSFIIPSIIMLFFLPDKFSKERYENIEFEFTNDAKIVLFLFCFTIAISIFFKSYLKLSSILGMMFGFSLLQVFERITKIRNKFSLRLQIFKIEWETLLFFYGIMLAVGCLNSIGLLHDLSNYMYNSFDSFISLEYKHTPANILIGFLSAIIDNIPITFAVIKMHPDMSIGQWLLVTLTTAIGGSIFSIGSAAGIAIMGKAFGRYTFLSHFKWSWVIIIGYLCGVFSHIILNKYLFFIY